MNHSISHLPEQKQNELKRIAATICQECDSVEMVLLFGSYARGDWKDGPHQQGRGRLTIHKKSDYDILAITRREYTAQDTRLWQHIKQVCEQEGLSTYLRIIPRDIDFVNCKLYEGQYFFSEIRDQGIVLYDRGNSTLSDKGALDLAESKRIALEDFTETFVTAEDFYLGTTLYEKEGKYKIAAFNLHQACEHAYKAVLLVFAGESPQEHHLDTLGDLAIDYCPALSNILPRETDSQQELFELLDYAYIGARYDKSYKISGDQVLQLMPCVKKLHTVIEQSCMDEISGISE